MNNTELDYTTGTPWLDCDLDGNVTEATEVSLKDAAEYTELTDYDTFFRSLAVVWLEKGTLQAAYRQINDVHPMGYLRVNCTLQQFDKFLDFYGITKGDGMYLASEDRVLIW